MKHSVLFRVELEFESNIDAEEELSEVAENIARAIVSEANGQGIAPVDSGTYLEIVRVTPWFSNKTVIEHV